MQEEDDEHMGSPLPDWGDKIFVGADPRVCPDSRRYQIKTKA